MALIAITTDVGRTEVASAISVTHVQAASGRMTEAEIRRATSLPGAFKLWSIEGVAQAILGEFQITIADTDPLAAYANLVTFGFWSGDPADMASKLLAVYSAPEGTTFTKVLDTELSATLFWAINASNAANVTFQRSIPLWATTLRSGLVQLSDDVNINDITNERVAVTPRGLHNRITAFLANIRVDAGVLTGMLNANVIPNLNAAKITTGVLALARIPDLPASKTNSGIFHINRIPNLPASRTTSGEFAVERIPGIPASKVTSETFAIERIPDIPASKVTSEVFDAARIPLLGRSKIRIFSGTASVAAQTVVTSPEVGDIYFQREA